MADNTRPPLSEAAASLDDDDKLNLSDAAAYLGVHRSTLTRWRARGVVPVIATPGGLPRFRRSDLDRLDT